MNVPLGETPPTDGPRDQRALLSATQELLWISSAEDAQAAAVRLVEALGGRVVPAEQADEDALPVDLSFGQGRPLLPVATRSGATHATLARALPAFVRDAHRAVELAARTERLAEEAPSEGGDASDAPPVDGYVALSHIEVPDTGSEAVVAAFHARLRAVDAWTGFDRLEVWAAQGDPTRLVMISWWDDEASFRTYMGSDDHRRSHARIPSGPDRPRPAGFESYQIVAR